MPELVCARTAAQFAQLRVPFAALREWDTAQSKLLGLDPQEVLKFYYASDGGRCRASLHRLRLATTTFMDQALAMYRSRGFQPCQPYYAIPEKFRGFTVFMELYLAETA